jgi:hypothetical protein
MYGFVAQNPYLDSKNTQFAWFISLHTVVLVLLVVVTFVIIVVVVVVVVVEVVEVVEIDVVVKHPLPIEQSTPVQAAVHWHV